MIVNTGYLVRHAAREIALSVLYQLLVRNPLAECYGREIAKLMEQVDKSAPIINGLQSRADFDSFCRLSGLHMAILNDAVKKHRTQEELAADITKRFRASDRRRRTGSSDRRAAGRKYEEASVTEQEKIYRRLTNEILAQTYAAYTALDFTALLLEQSHDLLWEGPCEDRYFHTAFDLLEKHSELLDEIKEYEAYLVEGAMDCRFITDKLIREYCADYNPYRVQPVIKAAVMIAVFEAEHSEDVNFRVAINEALELTREYAGEECVAFVNSLLQHYLDTCENKEK